MVANYHQRYIGARQDNLVAIEVAQPDLPMVWTPITVRRISMPRHDNFSTERLGTADRRIDVVDLNQSNKPLPGGWSFGSPIGP